MLKGKVMCMRLNRLLAAGLGLCLLLGGCATPDEALLQAGTELAIRETYKKDATDETSGNGTDAGSGASSVDIHADNGRRITETYGSGEFVFQIDAQVIVPDADPQMGTMSVKNLDIALIEKYLCNGEKLHETPTEQEEFLYTSDSNETGLDIGYDIGLHIYKQEPGTALYDNYKLDKYYVNDTQRSLSWQELNEEQKSVAMKIQDASIELMKNLGLETDPDYLWFIDNGEDDFCSISLCPLVDGYPVIQKDDYQYMDMSLMIGDRGVNGIQFRGLFEISDSEPVDILSLDEALMIVRKGVEEKNINTYEDAISSIRLGYMLDMTDDQISFYPVWSFGYRYADWSYDMPYLMAVCINAQTGAIEYMS